MKPAFLPLTALLVGLSHGPALAQSPAVVETPLGLTGDYDQVKAITFSDDSRHIALLGTKGDKQFIVRDGVTSPAYDWVIPDSLLFSPAGKHVACVIQEGNEMSALIDGKVVG
ncbi:MAG TPA: hypothetical protein VIM11_07495, partial [Tepidisphaeraceae bacterium]